MKYLKEVVLSLAPYKTIKLGVSEGDSFEEVDKALLKELDKRQAVKRLNKEEIENSLGGK